MSPAVTIKFDDDLNGGSVHSKTMYGGDIARLHRLKFNAERNQTAVVSLPVRTCLVFNWHGTTVAFAENSVTVAPPENVTLVLGVTEVEVLITSGRHVVDILQWHPQASPPFSAFLEAAIPDRHTPMTSVPLSTLDPSVVDRVSEAARMPAPACEFQLLAIAVELASRLVSLKSRLQIAPMPRDVSENLKELLEQVRSDPARVWSLTEASELAGYSSFHFSRMFKQTVGCGFHEFVDRLRTQNAVDIMTSERANLTDAAARAGFTSPRSLRESIRDYLGVSPSDLLSSHD